MGERRQKIICPPSPRHVSTANNISFSRDARITTSRDRRKFSSHRERESKKTWKTRSWKTTEERWNRAFLFPDRWKRNNRRRRGTTNVIDNNNKCELKGASTVFSLKFEYSTCPLSDANIDPTLNKKKNPRRKICRRKFELEKNRFTLEIPALHIFTKKRN